MKHLGNACDKICISSTREHTYRKNSHRRNGMFHTYTSLISEVYALEETFFLSEFLR